MSNSRQFATVWDAIADAPHQAGGMQPRLSDPARGRVQLVSLDVLMDMAIIAGRAPHIAVGRPKAARRRTPVEAQAA